MRPSVSSQHSRPPNHLISGDHNVRPEDERLLREWLLVLRGGVGRSAKTMLNGVAQTR